MAAYWNASGHASEHVASASQAFRNRINIMRYDMDLSRKGYAGFVDALWHVASDPSCEAEANSFTSYRIPKKIIVGFPFYGHAFSDTIGTGYTSPLTKNVGGTSINTLTGCTAPMT